MCLCVGTCVHVHVKATSQPQELFPVSHLPYLVCSWLLLLFLLLLSLLLSFELAK